MEVAVSDVLYDELKQRHLLGHFDQIVLHLLKSALKLGHAVREIMDPGFENLPTLSCIVELDEKYVGGKPRYQEGAYKA